MIKTHIPAVTGGLKIRIWGALRIEAQKRDLPVAGFVRRVFQHAMRGPGHLQASGNCPSSSCRTHEKALPNSPHDPVSKS